jgi:uncharacterized protein
MEKGSGQNDLMRYDLRLQEAMRGAIRQIMTDVARSGFPGDHHFYISFRTTARGVQMSDRLRKQYPDEMTIVLQHQFWDLVVTEREFSVGLSFKQIGEKLVIPFDTITSFVDPTVQFALKFDVASANDETAKPAQVTNLRPQAPAPVSDIDKDEPIQDKSKTPRRLTPKVSPAEDHAKAGEKPASEKPAADAPEKSAGSESGKIVSIDAFRKKP